ncbi:MAG: HSP20 family protein [Parcubacteria group bacterium Gr01-1014_48]|nr:MAG: HSP20 family protein [Parcubacteria group bacterium Greene0416_14]TSC73901.1 MAG: HSP20 family protein [Parcubacteria group bacterium Gr01-1014_48]TSC99862.1 MAG: HSP20 family protein [Parcubacteria group bacterium Greene1014_15]TSD06980.1 MAG: HSP20 family protein [Parcubacteria group bacterium Greene0714_4]
MKIKKSFFERLTGTVNTEFEDEFEDIAVDTEVTETEREEHIQTSPLREETPPQIMTNIRPAIQQSPMRTQQIQQMPRERDTLPRMSERNGWLEESSVVNEQEESVGQLPVDVYQTNDDIIIKTLVPGVRPENLEVNVTRDMVVIKGKREQAKQIPPENYFHQELYWGVFSRSVLLPQEIDTDQAEAVEHNGLLILRLPRINKAKQTKLKIRSA